MINIYFLLTESNKQLKKIKIFLKNKNPRSKTKQRTGFVCPANAGVVFLFFAEEKIRSKQRPALSKFNCFFENWAIGATAQNNTKKETYECISNT